MPDVNHSSTKSDDQEPDAHLIEALLILMICIEILSAFLE
jgi:hypothetical protein